jgi:bacillithiol system protein YtxJ
MDRNLSPNWKDLDSLAAFDEVLEKSRSKPALIFKHQPSSPESISVKRKFEEEWSFDDDQLDLYLVEENKSHDIVDTLIDTAGVDNEYPQVLLFADGVTMYDESHEMINVKKIKIALKIINRTFKWMESRA